MNISETIKNVVYENGTRISTVERVITRADDAEQLGSLYFRLSDIYRRLENTDISEDEKNGLTVEFEEVKAKIDEYREYLENYDR